MNSFFMRMSRRPEEEKHEAGEIVASFNFLTTPVDVSIGEYVKRGIIKMGPLHTLSTQPILCFFRRLTKQERFMWRMGIEGIEKELLCRCFPEGKWENRDDDIR